MNNKINKRYIILSEEIKENVLKKEIEKVTLESALESYGLTLQNINEFSKLTGIDYQTLKDWDRSGNVSNQGKVTLYYIQKIKSMENDLKMLEEFKQSMQFFKKFIS